VTDTDSLFSRCEYLFGLPFIDAVSTIVPRPNRETKSKAPKRAWQPTWANGRSSADTDTSPSSRRRVHIHHPRNHLQRRLRGGSTLYPICNPDMSHVQNLRHKACTARLGGRPVVMSLQSLLAHVVADVLGVANTCM
jgi:hypothetical protein